MLELGDALPDGARARLLKRQADTRLLSSLTYLYEAASVLLGEVNPGLLNQIDNAREAIQRGATLTAGVYGLHSRLVSVMRAGEAENVVHLLSNASSLEFLREDLAIWPHSSNTRGPFVHRLMDDVMTAEHLREYGIPYDAHPPASGDFSRLCSIIHSILDNLRTFDPETHAEVLTYASDIDIITSDTINAGSSFRVYGLILLRELGPEREWTTYLENIVHEAAHLHLFLVWTCDPVIENDRQEGYQSPLRPGARPLSAIFHAMFVLARTIRAVRIFAKIPEHRAAISRMSTSYNYLQNPMSFETKFLETYNTIRENAQLTNIGRELLHGCARLVFDDQR